MAQSFGKHESASYTPTLKSADTVPLHGNATCMPSLGQGQPDVRTTAGTECGSIGEDLFENFKGLNLDDTADSSHMEELTDGDSASSDGNSLEAAEDPGYNTFVNKARGLNCIEAARLLDELKLFPGIEKWAQSLCVNNIKTTKNVMLRAGIELCKYSPDIVVPLIQICCMELDKYRKEMNAFRKKLNKCSNELNISCRMPLPRLDIRRSGKSTKLFIEGHIFMIRWLLKVLHMEGKSMITMQQADVLCKINERRALWLETQRWESLFLEFRELGIPLLHIQDSSRDKINAILSDMQSTATRMGWSDEDLEYIDNLRSRDLHPEMDFGRLGLGVKRRAASFP